MGIIIGLLFFIFFVKYSFCFNDFPTLMAANATMAVVIEKTFYERKILAKEISVITNEAYQKSVATFGSAVTKIARERMNISGLGIHVFQDTGVNLERDYTILLSVATCSLTWNLFNRAKVERLVHLAITDMDCPRLPIDEGLSIPLIEPGEELAQIFYDIRITRGLKWQRAFIIHDDTFARDSIGNVVRAFSNELPDSTIGLASNSIYSIKRGKSETITRRRIAQTLANLPPRRTIDDRFLIFVGQENIPLFIEIARSLRMLHPYSQWLFIVPDMAKLSYGNVSYLVEYLSEGENIAFLYNDTNNHINLDNSCRIGAFCHARELVGALGMALERVLTEEIALYDRVTEEEFESTGSTKSVRAKHIISYIRDELYNDTKRHGGRGSTCGRCMRWIIASALTWGNKIGPEMDNEPHKLEQTGIWTPDPGFEYNNDIFPHVIHGFLRKTLPIATYHNPPWQFEVITAHEDKHKSGYENNYWDGLIFDIVEELATTLNFTFKPVIVEAPREIASIKANPKKAAMSAAEKVPAGITDLVRAKEVFLGACAYTVGNRKRDNTINFTHPITVQTYGLLAAKPKPLSRALLFASPYSTEAWACLASAIIVVGPILYAVHTFSPRRTDEVTKNPDIPVMLGLGSSAKCMWYIYGALLQQGGMHLPRTDGARLIVGTWWLVVMVVVATYSGSLVAFLTFPRMEPAIETVDDLLVRRAELTWSIPGGSFLEDFLIVSSADGVIDYRRLLKENEPHAETHDTVTYQQNVAKVKEGKHAVIDWTSSLRISTRDEHIETGICHFSLGTDILVLEEPISMVVPADSPYLGIINVQLQRMQEAGLLNKWIANWMPMKDQCWGAGAINRAADNHKVNLHDMQGIFFVLIFGYIVGSAFLGWEVFKHKRKLAKEAKLIHPFRD